MNTYNERMTKELQFIKLKVKEFCETGDLDIFDVLLKKYDVEKIFYGYIFSALLSDNTKDFPIIECAKKLLKNDMQPDNPKKIFKENDPYPLNESIPLSNKSFLEKIIMSKNKHIQSRGIDLFKLLMEYGANINEGVLRTPFMQAVVSGKKKYVDFLVSNDVDINKKSRGGFPIEFATDRQNGIFSYLLSLGANITKNLLVIARERVDVLEKIFDKISSSERSNLLHDWFAKSGWSCVKDSIEFMLKKGVKLINPDKTIDIVLSKINKAKVRVLTILEYHTRKDFRYFPNVFNRFKSDISFIRKLLLFGFNVNKMKVFGKFHHPVIASIENNRHRYYDDPEEPEKLYVLRRTSIEKEIDLFCEFGLIHSLVVPPISTLSLIEYIFHRLRETGGAIYVAVIKFIGFRHFSFCPLLKTDRFKEIYLKYTTKKENVTPESTVVFSRIAMIMKIEKVGSLKNTCLNFIDFNRHNIQVPKNFPKPLLLYNNINRQLRGITDFSVYDKSENVSSWVSPKRKAN